MVPVLHRSCNQTPIGQWSVASMSHLRGTEKTYNFMVSASRILTSVVSYSATVTYTLSTRSTTGDANGRVKSKEQCSYEAIGVDMHRSGVGSMLGRSETDSRLVI